MKKFFASAAYFFVGFTILFADLKAHEGISLSGKLVKKYYPAPCIVKNAAFGWYLELNKVSQEVLQKQFQLLSKEDQRIFKELDADLQMVQCVAWTDDILLQARSFEGSFVTLEGKLEAPCLSRKYLCFSIESDVISSEDSVKNKKKHSSVGRFEHLSERFYIKNGSSDDDEDESLLQLPQGAPEKLVTLKGKLILRLFPGPPEYASIEMGDRADYCWMLHMDEESFRTVTTTLVPEPASDLKSIMKWSNHKEIYLSLKENITDFCCDHESKEVIAQGYLFHAHTAHPLYWTKKQDKDDRRNAGMICRIN